jgi:hypothetical protein
MELVILCYRLTSKWLSRTYGDNKILYFVGWVRRGDTFDDKLITFAPRHQRIICNLLYTLPQDARRAEKLGNQHN